MRLTPKELEGLLLHQAGYLAQKRLARGVLLNHPEAVALICSQVGTSCCSYSGDRTSRSPNVIGMSPMGEIEEQNGVLFPVGIPVRGASAASVTCLSFHRL